MSRWLLSRVVIAALVFLSTSVVPHASAQEFWGLNLGGTASSNGELQLVRFTASDPSNVTVVGVVDPPNGGLPGGTDGYGLDFDRFGNLWLVSRDGFLWRVDTATGVATPRFQGMISSWDIYDAAYDPVSDRVYGLGYQGSWYQFEYTGQRIHRGTFQFNGITKCGAAVTSSQQLYLGQRGSWSPSGRPLRSRA